MDEKQIANGGWGTATILTVTFSRRLVGGSDTDWVYSVCFSPDGKRLAGGSGNQTVTVWDIETGVVLATLDGHPYAVMNVAFSPDGLKLAAGSMATIRVWRTDNAELLLEINSQVQSVVWSPDGQQLVSVTVSGKTVKFWNSSNGDQIGQPCTSHARYIDSLTISSDACFITTVSDDKIVQLWTKKRHQHIGQALEYTTRVEQFLPMERGSYGEDEPVDLEFHSRALRSIVRLGQPFGALLLAQQRGGEYASDHNIIVQVRDVASVHDMMDTRTLEIL